jgi:hypothetical protein
VNEDAALGERPCRIKDPSTFQGAATKRILAPCMAARLRVNISGVHMQWFSVIIEVDAYLVDMKHSEKGESPGILVR